MRGVQTSAYSVHTSVDKCRQVHTACIQKMRLSTLRNVLVISEVHTKVQSADSLQNNFFVGFVIGEN